jgi:hypothetical protein
VKGKVLVRSSNPFKQETISFKPRTLLADVEDHPNFAVTPRCRVWRLSTTLIATQFLTEPYPLRLSTFLKESFLRARGWQTNWLQQQ